MKKWIILSLAALMALLSCAEIGNEYDNPWDKRGSNYRGDDPCFVNPTASGCGSGGNTFVDGRDSKTYKKVVIGTQTWMAENLNYDVPNTTSDVCYGNSADSCAKYGRLYNWSTAMNGASSSSLSPSGVQGVCPAGWHLPSDDEWITLTDYVGGSATKLKSTSGWNYGGNGTDSYGFSALPGGRGNSDGNFIGAGSYGSWWSATEDGADDASYRSMPYNYEYVLWYGNGKADLFSVRCVEGAGIQTPTTYTLNVIANPETGGSVSKSPDKSEYATGETVYITATPKTGYGFAGWSGDSEDTASTITVKMDGNKELTAKFGRAYALTFNYFPNNAGIVSRSPDKNIYVDGERVTITAKANPGYIFERWIGLTTSENTADSVVTITMTGDREIGAIFIRVYNVTIIIEPEGSADVEYGYPLKPYYNEGDSVVVTVTEKPEYKFVNWLVEPAGIAPTNSRNIRIAVGKEDIVLTARFEAETDVTP